MYAVQTNEDKEYDKKINSGKYVELLLTKKQVKWIKEEIIDIVDSITMDLKDGRKMSTKELFSKKRFMEHNYKNYDVQFMEKLYGQIGKGERRER